MERLLVFKGNVPEWRRFRKAAAENPSLKTKTAPSGAVWAILNAGVRR